MKLFVCFSLILNIAFDHFFIAILANGVEVESACPKGSSPQKPFDVRVLSENLLGRDAFDRLSEGGGRKGGDALDEEVDVIFVSANFDKMEFVSLT